MDTFSDFAFMSDLGRYLRKPILIFIGKWGDLTELRFEDAIILSSITNLLNATVCKSVGKNTILTKLTLTEV